MPYASLQFSPRATASNVFPSSIILESSTMASSTVKSLAASPTLSESTSLALADPIANINIINNPIIGIILLKFIV